MKYGITFILFFALCTSKAQTNKQVELCKEVENTYQIVSSSERIKLAITSDVCETVKRERKKDKTFIYYVNEFYSIKIYSEKDIPLLKLPLQYIIYNAY